MHAIYDYLQRNYKIGPLHLVDGQPQEKPFQEYPKWITDASGNRVIVKDLSEEIRVAGKAAESGGPADPLQAEKDKLAAENDKLSSALREVEELKAKMRAELDELNAAREKLLSGAPAAPDVPAVPPVKPQAGTKSVVTK